MVHLLSEFAGIAFYRFNNFEIFESKIVLAIFTILFLVIQLFNLSLDSSFAVLDFFVAVTSIIFILSISCLKLGSILKEIGSASLAIYLIHVIIGSGARIFLLKILKIDSLCIHLFFGTVLGLFFPFLIFKMKRYVNISWLFYYPITKFFRK